MMFVRRAEYLHDEPRILVHVCTTSKSHGPVYTHIWANLFISTERKRSHTISLKCVPGVPGLLIENGVEVPECGIGEWLLEWCCSWLWLWLCSFSLLWNPKEKSKFNNRSLFFFLSSGCWWWVLLAGLPVVCGNDGLFGEDVVGYDAEGLDVGDCGRK